MFVSSEAYNGFLGGIDTADAKCQYLASGANLPGTWKALLSTATTDARSRLAVAGGIYAMTGQKIADDASSFWDGNLASSYNYDESGNQLSSCPSVWTGTASNGTLSGYGCYDGSNTPWMSSATAGTGTIGASCVLDHWLDNGTQSCGSLARLYCVEQISGVTSSGSTGRRIFVSSESYTLDQLGGLSGADSKCNYLASARGGLTGTWKALLSETLLDTRQRISIPGQVLDIAGNVVAYSESDLWDGTLSYANGIKYNESGGAVTTLYVWTGTTSNGVSAGSSDNCSSGNDAWRSTSASLNATLGQPNDATSAWINASSVACNTATAARIYCIEQ
jgi:hypothetical protein